MPIDFGGSVKTCVFRGVSGALRDTRSVFDLLESVHGPRQVDKIPISKVQLRGEMSTPQPFANYAFWFVPELVLGEQIPPPNLLQCRAMPSRSDIDDKNLALCTLKKTRFVLSGQLQLLIAHTVITVLTDPRSPTLPL